MKRTLMILPAFVLLLVVAPARAEPWDDPDDRPANLNGPWYMNGNPDQPCYIREAPDGRALFTNENGSRARGVVRSDRVWIPDWSPGRGIPGLEGRIRGDRIVWPDGNYWSR